MDIKLKVYFLTKNYDKIKEQITQNEEIVLKLDRSQLQKILEYTKKNQEWILLSTILRVIIKGGNNQIDDSILEPYIDYFVDFSLKNLVFLYSIAITLSNDPEKYQKQINKIQAFRLNHELSEITIFIQSLNGFYSLKFEDKVLKSKNSRFIFCLLQGLNIEETKRVLAKYVLTKPSTSEVYYLAESLNSSVLEIEELMNLLLSLDVTNSMKSRYLIAIYQGTFDEHLKQRAVYEVLELNCYADILSLMKKLRSQEQASLATIYLNVRNENIIFALACTTNCKKTKDLIDAAFTNIDEQHLIKLIALVDDEFLYYVLEKVFNVDSKIYLKILNNLYLLGSNRWMKMINYIVDSKKEKLIDQQVLSFITNLKNNNETQEKKRTLT